MADGIFILAGASVRSLAESAARIGLVPWCVDFFGDSDLLQTLHQCGGRFLGRVASFAELPDLCRPLDARIPILCGGGIENYPEILVLLSAQRVVLNASIDAIGAVRRIELLYEGMRCRDITTPEITGPGRPVDGRRWLVKPRRSCGGIGITVLSAGSDRTERTSHIVQEYIEGVPFSALCLADDRQATTVVGTSLQCVGWKSLNATGFQYCGTLGRMTLSEKQQNEVRHIARSVVDYSGMVGAFGIDLVLRSGRIWLIEVNPRLPATHTVFESEAESPLQDHLAAMIGTKNGHDQPRRTGDPGDQDPALVHRAEFIIYARHDVTRFRTDWIPSERLAGEATKRLTSPEMSLADIPTEGATIPAGTPCCTLIVRAPSMGDVPCALTNVELPVFLRSHVDRQAIAVAVDRQVQRFQAES
jgi:uncharacterized protein